MPQSMSLITALPLPMNDQPYTSPDEDPFSIRPFVEDVPEKALKHRRSSMLDKWIQEQQAQSSDAAQAEPLEPPRPYFATSGAFASSSNPYLAYPDLPRVASDREASTDIDEAASIISYDLIDDDDIPCNTLPETETTLASPEAPVTPNHPRTHKSSRSSITPSFRALNLNFRSASPAPSSSSNNMEAVSRAFERFPFFPRTPRTPSSTSKTPQHMRSSSHSSTLSNSTFNRPVRLSGSAAKWRPSVLGHFHQPSASESSIAVSEAQYTPSRPSISSGDTYSTSNTSQTATTIESNIPSTPSKISFFESMRMRGNKSTKTFSTFSAASTSSVRISKPQPPAEETGSTKAESTKGTLPRRPPLAPKAGSMLDNIDDESDLDVPTYRFPKHASSRPPIPTSSSGTLPRVKFSSLNSRSRRKGKKLVISGIGATEMRKFEGVKRWCESFGEVRCITRMPNGDLQIDFRDQDVADTVCRVRAKVFISGVGSVQLSWVAGNKR